MYISQLGTGRLFRDSNLGQIPQQVECRTTSAKARWETYNLASFVIDVACFCLDNISHAKLKECLHKSYIYNFKIHSCRLLISAGLSSSPVLAEHSAISTRLFSCENSKSLPTLPKKVVLFDWDGSTDCNWLDFVTRTRLLWTRKFITYRFIICPFTHCILSC